MENDEKPLASIILRTKNEETWITHCLNAIFNQVEVSFEVILVDNESTDSTLSQVKNFPVKVLSISEFLPGKALNIGIENAQGEFVVCLSGHCVPTSEYWLKNLLQDFKDPNVAGIYGRQLPLSYSSDIDKRDLLTTFGMDKKIQFKDPFFHNANSAVRKSIWEKIPFDGKVTNVEDRIWGKKVIDEGMTLVYEPEASVYHWHGINHDANPLRAKKVMAVLETAGVYDYEKFEPALEKEFSPIFAIPARAKDVTQIGIESFTYMITEIKSRFVASRIALISDDLSLIEKAKSLQVEFIIERDIYSTFDFVDVFEILKRSDSEIQNQSIDFSHWILLNGNFPFRNWESLSKKIRDFQFTEFDSLISVTPLNHSLWSDDANEDGSVAYSWTKELPASLNSSRKYVSIFGYGSILSRDFIREEVSLGKRIKLNIIESKVESLEIKTKDDLMLITKSAKS